MNLRSKLVGEGEGAYREKQARRPLARAPGGRSPLYCPAGVCYT